ncbi:MAG: NAD-binding protein [Spirochaetales bacterium]|nr:NAD-binding protein [Spirochaetales bacterium]
MNRKNRIIYVLWIIAVTAILFTGLYFLPFEDDKLGFWESLYGTLRMFVFERDLSIFPKSWPVILIYFAAPLLTLSILGKLVSYLFRLTPSIWSRWMKNHVIICGAGRLGKVMALTIKRHKVPVTVIDKNYNDDLENWVHKYRIPIVSGDFNLPSVLKRAGMHNARALVFTTSEDLVNIDAAFSAYGSFKTLKGEIRLFWTHISDNALANTLRNTVETEGKIGIRFFDTYHIAAKQIVRKYFDEKIKNRIKEIVLVGYGKLGTDLLVHLALSLKGRKRYVIRVIDKQDVSSELKRQAGMLGISRRVVFHRQDIRDLVLDKKMPRIFFLCTDSDLGNLSLALNLSETCPGDDIIVRMGHWPMQSVSEYLGGDKGLVFVNINDIITQCLEEIPGILNPASDKDLKRVKKT